MRSTNNLCISFLANSVLPPARQRDSTDSKNSQQCLQPAAIHARVAYPKLENRRREKRKSAVLMPGSMDWGASDPT
jgi:hypothetical protein